MNPGPEYDREIWRALGELGQWICKGCFVVVVIGIAANYWG